MHLLTLLVVVVSSLGLACSETLPLDEVVPFPEVDDSSIVSRLALKFKPQLYINLRCYPYPAVDAEGRISAGLQSYKFSGCRGSPLGSQVYGRAAQINNHVGIMYAWFTPRDSLLPTLMGSHFRSWVHVIVWVSSLTEDAKLVSLTVPTAGSYYTNYNHPSEKQMDGSHIKIKYKSMRFPTFQLLEPTSMAGTYQDLVMWYNLTDPARQSLENIEFHHQQAPIGTSKFEKHVRDAYPF